ncbi:unnamed protein product [Cunninghamella blakesleeana]
MSINWVMLSQDGRSPVPLPQEKMFFSQESVKMVLDCNENSGYPGNTGGYWDRKGTVYLSNQRIIFIAKEPTQEFQSLNIPLLNLKQWKLEQPWFGANYIEGAVIPVPNGGLKTAGKLVLTFIDGGATEFTTIFHSLLERLAETNEMPSHYEALPTYMPPPPPQQQQQQPSSSNHPSSILPNELPPSYDEAQYSMK